MTMDGNAHPARSTADPAFVALALAWARDPAGQLLGFVWSGYDSLRQASPAIDARDLERSITQLLAPRIQRAMTGDEPFYMQHGPFERETMKPPPAQPPQYDLAFVLRADERIMWPLEAKVLETPRQVAHYVRDVRDEFLTCRYAPFSASGAMLAYLLDGEAADALAAIAASLGCPLEPVDSSGERSASRSRHDRAVPSGKSYPVQFICYHLVLGWHGLARAGQTKQTTR